MSKRVITQIFVRELPQGQTQTQDQAQMALLPDMPVMDFGEFLASLEPRPALTAEQIKQRDEILAKLGGLVMVEVLPE